MSNIIVLSSKTCPPCTHLKAYLKARRIEFQEVDLHSQDPLVESLIEISKVKMIPQVFIKKKGNMEFLFKGMSVNNMNKLEELL